jgi:hypothetical protein
MAIKTFTSGEVLTASDTNTYLANSGLVYVASGALSSTGTNFQGCFTSTYTNYRLVFDSIQVSAAADIYFRFLSGTTPAITTNYDYAFLGLTAAGATSNSTAAGDTYGFTGISITGGGVGSTVFAQASMDVFGPQLAQRTQVLSVSPGVYAGNFGVRTGMSAFSLTSVFDGIAIYTRSAATMGGNVTIYGYRKG